MTHVAAALSLIALALSSAPELRLTAPRTYFSAFKPVEVTLAASGASTASPEAELRLIDPATGATLAGAGVAVPTACVDVTDLFPALRDDPPPRAVLIQGYIGVEAAGTPLVLVPMWTPLRHVNALEAAVLDAARERSVARITQLLSLRPTALDELIRRVAPVSPEPRSFGGFRVIPDRRIVFQTSLGRVELALRHDQAPNACAAVLRLVDGGFYDGLTIHRVVPRDRDGNPFIIQLGDPSAGTDGSGSGYAGAGERLGFEPTDLPQDFGVVSLARAPDDPDSASSQLVICLSAGAGRLIQGSLTAFAVIVSGADTLGSIEASPVGPRDPDDPASPRDRPLAPIVIERAFSVPAPAFTVPIRPVGRAAIPPLER